MLLPLFTGYFWKGMPVQVVSRRESVFLVLLFTAAVIYSGWNISYHWTMGFMSGHEFRQAQTAITSYYIDKDNNFSLRYETPIVGKPWAAVLLEVPFYEWAVVGLSRATGWPHVVAARTITATCFYLTLPAVWLLLGRLGVPRVRRLLPLALILSAPVYIYYSRAFLMDSMALMCSAWWLAAFVRTMDTRRWPWLALAIVAGTVATLIKSAVWAAWLVPGAGYGAWLLWCDLRAREGWRRPLATILWGLATVVVAFGFLRAWIAYTDPIKAAHASAWIFTSKNLALGNWGLFDLKAIIGGGVWRLLMQCWEQAIMSRWVIGVWLIAGLCLPTVRWHVLGAGGAFFIAQLLFPFAYAYQDYYYYACAAFLCVAVGFTLLGLMDSRLPRWVVLLAVAVPFAAQVRAYWQDYRVGQAIWHTGGYPFTDVLRNSTPKHSVIVVAGADWAAMTPLYAQRKALMIRNGLEYDRPYLERAFSELADEEVSALVVVDKVRSNRGFVEFATARLNMDASGPTFSYTTADIYISRPYAKLIQLRLRDRSRYPELKLPANVLTEMKDNERVAISPEQGKNEFQNIEPAPYQVAFQFGLGWFEFNNKAVLSAHPESDLWIKPPANTKQITWAYGMFDSAFANPNEHTDGVEFLIYGELPDGPTRLLYRRLLDPFANPADRGGQQAIVPYVPLPEENLRFSTRPNGTSAFDWTYTATIKVQ